MENNYYKDRDGNLYTDLTKEELKHISFSFDTLNEILRIMDYPVDNNTLRNLYLKFPDNNWFGRYISFMNLIQMKNYRYKDTEIIKLRYGEF